MVCHPCFVSEDVAPDRAAAPAPDAAAKARLAELVNQLAVVHGKVTLSSGREADYYVDLRRATLHHEAGPLIGILLRKGEADLSRGGEGWGVRYRTPFFASVTRKRKRRQGAPFCKMVEREGIEPTTR